MTAYESYAEVAASVRANDGVLVTQAGYLRDVHGAQGLGRNVRAEIASKLAGHGIACYAESDKINSEIPDRQDKLVLLVEAESPADYLIDAILNFDPTGALPHLRLINRGGASGTDDVAEVISRVRKTLDQIEAGE